MYSWIWRHLPGPVPVRAIITLAVVLAVVAICFQWLFPALAPHMPFNDNTVGS